MPDPTTSNRGLAVQVHGSNVDTWDAPLNGNFGLLDTIVGGVANISTTGGNTFLNATQLACGTISITGALISVASIFFPAVQGWWTIRNFTTNNNTFQLTIQSGAGTTFLGIPPGEAIDIQINGDVPEYRNLGRIGSYLDLASATVPPWISASTVPPYLNCDGSAFSAVTYPTLAAILGTTTLPDLRGRSRYYLNGGTGRLTTAGAGIDGDTRFSPGGFNGVTLLANRIPSLTSVNSAQPISVDSTVGGVPSGATRGDALTPNTGGPGAYYVPGSLGPLTVGVLTSTKNNSISTAYTNASQQLVNNAAPGAVGGITLIRAA